MTPPKPAGGEPTPAIGQWIYVPSAFYIDHGEDDRLGGRAKVMRVETGVSAGRRVPFVEVEAFPGHSFNWPDYLAPEQAALRKEFGRKKAKPDPEFVR